MASAIDQDAFDKIEKFYLECRDDAADVQRDLKEQFTKYEEDYDFDPKTFKQTMAWKRLALKNPLKARIAWDNFKRFVQLSGFEKHLAPLLGDQPEGDNESGFADTSTRRRGRGRPPGSKNKPKVEYPANVTPMQAESAA